MAFHGNRAAYGRVYRRATTHLWSGWLAAFFRSLVDINTDYDAESFLWVLLWTTYCYDKGALVYRNKLVGWTNPNWQIAGLAKSSFLMDYQVSKLKLPTLSHTSSGDVIDHLTEIFRGRRSDIGSKSKALKRRNKKRADGTELEVLPPTVPILSSALSQLTEWDDLPSDVKTVFSGNACHTKAFPDMANYVLSADSPVWEVLANKDSFGCSAT
jgi:hypothetical protein